jgi:hypothetical protein
MAGYLKVNGVVLKTPKVFKVDVEDIDSESGRNAKGEMNRDRVGVKRKLNIEWGPLDDREISRILQSVQEVFFEATYPDPVEGKPITKTFYVGTRSAPTYSWHDVFPKWEGLSMNFIER